MNPRRIPYPWRQAEPYRHTRRDHVRDVLLILAPYAVIGLWCVAFWFYFAIAAQVAP